MTRLNPRRVVFGLVATSLVVAFVAPGRAEDEHPGRGSAVKPDGYRIVAND